MSDLRLYIEKHKLTQSEAAKRLGIAQSRVRPRSAEWDKFSLEMLIGISRYLNPQTVSVKIETTSS